MKGLKTEFHNEEGDLIIRFEFEASFDENKREELYKKYSDISNKLSDLLELNKLADKTGGKE